MSHVMWGVFYQKKSPWRTSQLRKKNRNLSGLNLVARYLKVSNAMPLRILWVIKVYYCSLIIGALPWFIYRFKVNSINKATYANKEFFTPIYVTWKPIAKNGFDFYHLFTKKNSIHCIIENDNHLLKILIASEDIHDHLK